MGTGQFENIDLSVLSDVADLFKRDGNRCITGIHLHHSRLPDYTLFQALSDKFDDATASGRECCSRLARHHTEDRGFSDIAAHLIVDPAGTLWLGRRWDKPPVSARGFNGNFENGPLMVVMIGNFCRGQDQLNPEQRVTTIDALTRLMSAFDIKKDAFRLHHELSSDDFCTSQAFDRQTLLAELNSSKSDKVSAAKRSARSRPPMAQQQSMAYTLFRTLSLDPEGAENVLSDRELLGEPHVEHLPDSAITTLTETRSMRSRASNSRGGRDFELTPQMRDQLKAHVINLRQGEFSDSGGYASTPHHVDRMVDQLLEQWINDRRGDEPAHIMIHAHGGLNNEEQGLEYAWRMHRWWLDQGIYPIYFVWETGALESFLQLIEEYIHPGRRGFFDDLKESVGEVRDAALEALIRSMGTDFWTIMKLAARRASDGTSGSGAFYLSQKLSALNKKHEGKLEVHAVSHSAGAIFQSYFLRQCAGAVPPVPVASCSLIAPACTVKLFTRHIRQLLDGDAIKKLFICNLDRETERHDSTVPAYGKSLLHLVSNGFEGRRDTPIFGMEEAIDQDGELAEWLGLGGRDNPKVNVIFSPTEPGSHIESSAEATTHGGLSTDNATLKSVAARILGRTRQASIPDTPFKGSNSRNMSRLVPRLHDRLDPSVRDILVNHDTAGQAPSYGTNDHAPSSAYSTTSAPVVSGIRRALCIGIDAYEGDKALHGCVNDAENWEKQFNALGFQSERLHDHQATFDGILSSMNRLIRNAESGDIIAIQYAGHGVQFPDDSGDERDNSDEALVPIDHEHGRYISDDELWNTFQQAKPGVHLYVFMDCCHSKSNSRALGPLLPEGFTPRLISPDRAMAVQHRTRVSREVQQSPAKTIEAMNHVKYAACQDKEFAFESNGAGRFTTAALKAMSNMSPNLSNDGFRLAIENHFARDENQHPSVECPTAMRLRSFLGGAAV